jgi:hypothetical protein
VEAMLKILSSKTLERGLMKRLNKKRTNLITRKAFGCHPKKIQKKVNNNLILSVRAQTLPHTDFLVI